MKFEAEWLSLESIILSKVIYIQDEKNLIFFFI